MSILSGSFPELADRLFRLRGAEQSVYGLVLRQDILDHGANAIGAASIHGLIQLIKRAMQLLSCGYFTGCLLKQHLEFLCTHF
jgi:hypothetical protein